MTHLEVFTLSCQDDLVSFHFPAILGAESDIMQEAFLFIIDLPQILYQLQRMFLRYKSICTTSLLLRNIR